MKYTILALCISASLVTGCSRSGNDDKDVVIPPVKQSISLKAFDGAVWGMDSEYACEDGTTGTMPKTDYDGVTTFETTSVLQVVINPEKCNFTFLATENAIDTSNGKPMHEVTYKIPTGLASLDGAAITASPISTLIADTLGDSPYDESTANEVMTALGLGDLATTSGISITAFLQDVEGSLNKISESGDSELHSLVSATNVVLSDMLVVHRGKDTVDVDDIALATQNVAATVVHNYPDYPLNESGEEIYMDVTDIADDLDTLTHPDYEPAEMDLPEPEVSTPPEKPEDPKDPPTGGTGGTGGNGGGGTGG